MLPDRLARLHALRGVRGRLRERGRGHPDPLDPDTEARFVHEREDLLPSVAGFAQARRTRSLEDQGARRRAADRELVLCPLDDVVVAVSVGDEQSEAVQPARSLDAAREDDDELTLPGRDELLATAKDPAAVGLPC